MLPVLQSPSSKDPTFKVEPHLLSHMTYFSCHLWIKNLKLIEFLFFDGWGVKGVLMWKLTVGGRQEMGGGEVRWGWRGV